jgi:predicted amidohydrolase YtcJ
MTFDEKERGVLRPGMVADMIVLPTNIFTSDPELLRTIRPLQTIVAGKTVYSGSGTAAPQHSEQDRGPTMANAHDD